ncbi:transporter [Thioalkalivibrio versutus]|uniref:Transporter n=1 Tax=Thioalkalivibrio versutus TaxID=106634 RepID=A0A0G3G4A5_9GAMM|nr:TolC family protein [Thioalkalivibrio versutus]AKJ94347.1 transporter [Thioalkalivibrio versutus]
MPNSVTSWSVAGLIGLLCLPAVHADTDRWTLERSVTHGLSVAPEAEAFEHRIDAQRGARDQAGRWPNPTLEAEASDQLGMEDGRGGYSLSGIAVTQPLPLWGQIGHRRDAASARLAATEAQTHADRLELEGRIGAAFHAWQQAEAGFELARERLDEAERLGRIARLRQERGDLSERERLRIDLFRSEAMRQLEAAEGERTEARATLAAWLDRRPAGMGTAPAFDAPPPRPTRAAPGTVVDRHPALRAASERQQAAQLEIARARAEGRPDIGIRLFQEREVIDGRRDTSTGIGLQLELPLWDRNQGRVRESVADHYTRQTERRALQRDLTRQVEVGTVHLAHLLDELERHRGETLAPARRVRELTYRGYEAGEASLLELLEAYNTHFNAIEQEHELLAQSWAEWRELRIAAGLSLAEDTQ